MTNKERAITDLKAENDAYREVLKKILKRFDDVTGKQRCFCASFEKGVCTPCIARAALDKFDPDQGRTVCKHGSTEPMLCKECRND